MYEIEVESRFSATHALPLHNGATEALHGHDWRVVVSLAAAELDSCGMVADFCDVKKILDEMAGRLHHQNLNQLQLFAGGIPSAENVARCIHNLMTNDSTWGHLVQAVRVEEAPGCWAGFRGPGARALGA